MKNSSEFWNALAPYHAALENSYFDLAASRRIVNAIEQQPVLVVGAGQGLIVGELRKRGFQCDGIDLSSEMVRYAKLRRGLTLVEADARDMPFENESYRTVIYATGVLDFMGDEQEIRAILSEGRRVASPSGKIFVAFYRLSRGQEDFLTRVGLLSNNVLSHRQCLEMYLLNPVEMVSWVAKQARVGYFRATAMLLALSVFTTIHEKGITFRMQRIFRNPNTAQALIEAAQEKQPYRNEAEITHLFARLAIPIKQVQGTRSCWLVEI
jgi:ubiquinone/menaquinone biosynthesis C-methylase UbiE